MKRASTKNGNGKRDAVEEPAAVWVDVARLKPWDKNPRLNDEAVAPVAASLKRFGFASPIVARRADGEIIAGHTRLKAAVALGLKRVPVRYVDLDPADAHLLAVADNRLGEVAAWDPGPLAEVLDGYDEADRVLAGFTQDDLDDLVRDSQGGQEVQEDEMPEPPKVPVTKAGDVWVLGRHRLVCGDCRRAGDVQRLVNGAKVNIAFTSPPYASQRKYDEASGFEPVHPDKYVAWFEPVQVNVRDVLAEDGSWFVNIKEHCDDGQRSLYVKDLTIAHVRQWGWRYIDELCWVRQGVPGHWPNRFKNAWEPLFQFAIDEPKFRSEHVLVESDDAYAESTTREVSESGFTRKRGLRVQGLAQSSNVVVAYTGGTGISSAHSAGFPVQLPGFFIRAYTDNGDSVFDPFLGSGTTLIAAEQLNRRCFGIEISPAYCDVIVERWQNLTGEKATRE